jgi:hypothetical protein
LASQVEVLHATIKRIEQFATEEGGTLPSSKRKVETLVIARKAAEAALEEVDEFLKKTSSMGTQRKRMIDRARFIMKDVDALKKKVASSSQMLQLSYQDLTL